MKKSCRNCGEPATRFVTIDIDAHFGPVEDGEFQGYEDGDCLSNTVLKEFLLCDNCDWQWRIPRALLRKVAKCISLYRDEVPATVEEP